MKGSPSNIFCFSFLGELAACSHQDSDGFDGTVIVIADKEIVMTAFFVGMHQVLPQKGWMC
jgi:hypothetical protein